MGLVLIKSKLIKIKFNRKRDRVSTIPLVAYKKAGFIRLGLESCFSKVARPEPVEGLHYKVNFLRQHLDTLGVNNITKNLLEP
jgi:hypothetical protein